ncbi:MAG: AAA family ATPase [Caldilineaceae bacterium]|nr:AAA family ATPase [Caldilineaceae bacterium]
MITSVRLVNFKNFADETLRVGPFTVIVGANATGKSNIRDAFRFLHGIGRGYTLADIIGGKHGGGGQIEWPGVRGAMNEIIRFGQPSFSLQVEEKDTAYTIEVGRNETEDAAFRVNREKLKTQLGTIFTSTSVGGKPVHTQGDILYLLLRKERNSEEKGNISCVEGSPNQPGLTQIQGQNMSPWVQEYFAEILKKVLANMRFLDLDPHQLRQPAFPGQLALGDSGENLPTVLRAICEDPQKKETLVEWMRELTPMDVCDFEFPTDPTGRVHLVFLEANGRKVSADAASDGTLRFLAMLAVLLGPDPNGLYFFEEIDNGIHPARQWLLLELIEKQTAKQGIQVITTTHSPDLLTVMNDETFKNTSVVCRLEDADDAIIRPVAELPRAGELRKSQGLSNLLSGGWMEDALAFTEGYDEEVEN